MRRSQRRVHLVATSALLLIVPGILAISLAARPAEPSVTALPVAAVDVGALDVAAALRARLLERPAEPDRLMVTGGVLRTGADVVVYWAPTPPSGAALPDDAILLGAGPAGPEFDAPAGAELRAGPGVVVLFSVAHGEVLASVPVATGAAR